MSAVLNGARHLRQGIGVSAKWHGQPSAPAPSRSIHIPTSLPHPSHPPPPTPAQRLLSQTRTLFSRFIGYLTAPGLGHVATPRSAHATKSLLRPAHYYSSSQSIQAGFSLPVKHALSRPLSAPRLPRPPAVPANVTHVGLGTARAFHSGRPIFQNMIENVPIATRALWEAEWKDKQKQKEARNLRRAKENRAPVPKTQDKLKLRQKPSVPEVKCPHIEPSELDFYFPAQAAPTEAAYLLVPLAPTPTARLPLSAGNDMHPLLPISEVASTHYAHRLHTFRVSTLFARLDAGNVWDDPGVGVDAYAYGPRDGDSAREKQCTVLRVSFAGWTADRVRAIVGDTVEGWCTLEETTTNTSQPSVEMQDTPTSILSPLSVPLDSESVSELELDDTEEAEAPDYGLGFSLPTTAIASAQHEFIIPTLDFSSSFSQAAHAATAQTHPEPEIFLRTTSELACDTEVDTWSLASASSSPSVMSLSLSDSDDFPVSPLHTPALREGAMDESWDRLDVGLSSSFLQNLGQSELSGW
ncbi:hypothetical protein ID866_4293 [Astraeus odoratus]|nr:hypothetical protein ID866_4293 [Astraeus odoratus]